MHDRTRLIWQLIWASGQPRGCSDRGSCPLHRGAWTPLRAAPGAEECHLLGRARRFYRAARAERGRENDACSRSPLGFMSSARGRSASSAWTSANGRSECLRRIGVVFQQPTLDLDLYGRTEPLLSLRFARPFASRCRASGAHAEIERVGLADQRRDKVRQLSGGQRRRVEIARCSVAPAASVVARRADGRARYRQPAIHARPRAPAVPRGRHGGALGDPSDRRGRRGRTGGHIAQGRGAGGGRRLPSCSAHPRRLRCAPRSRHWCRSVRRHEADPLSALLCRHYDP